MVFEVVLRDGSCEQVGDADTYRPEGPLTTFFRTEPGRGLVDAWAERVASFRTNEICRIRRHPVAAAGPEARRLAAVD